MSRAGRKRNPKAKRHQTTVKGRSPDVLAPPHSLLRRGELLSLGLADVKVNTNLTISGAAVAKALGSGTTITAGGAEFDLNHLPLKLVYPQQVTADMVHTAIGRLRARHHITQRQYWAGQSFQGLYWKAFGTPFVNSRDYEKPPLPPSLSNFPSKRDEQKATVRIMERMEVSLAPRVYQAVYRLVISDTDPAWAYDKALSPVKQLDRADVKKGLSVLEKSFGQKAF